MQAVQLPSGLWPLAPLPPMFSGRRVWITAPPGRTFGGATVMTYTTPPTTAKDNGTLYRTFLRNNLGTTQSDAATLFMVPIPVSDSIVPTQASALEARNWITALKVTFSGPPLRFSRNYRSEIQVTTAGRDGVYGTEDDHSIKISTVRYMSSSCTLTVKLKHGVATRFGCQLRS